LQGIFALREINVSIREDKALRNGSAATCSGSMLLDKAGFARTPEGHMVGVRVDVARACGPTSPAGLLTGKRTKVWMSPVDVANLTGQASSATENGIDATLILLPKTLVAEPSGH
jgi:hypothetical protein